jgi:hypothetical protein
MSRKTYSYGRLRVSSLFLAIAVSVSTVGAQSTAPAHLGRGGTSAQVTAKTVAHATSGFGRGRTAVDCSGGTGAASDPGAPKGTYNVAVTGTAGSETSQSQVSASVPITID